ncbi:MAG: hypothetical protein L3J67_10345 [Hyphomicrobiaceae bacterium]|nr:hypothetical protein [Hyphomicrobiaceae bacterium]
MLDLVHRASLSSVLLFLVVASSPAQADCRRTCQAQANKCLADTARLKRPDGICWNMQDICNDACGNSAPTPTGSNPFAPGNPPRNPTGLPPQAPNGPQAPDQVVTSPTIINVGKWGGGIAYDGNHIWVAESGQRTVAKVDLHQGRVVKRFKVGRLPTDMVATGNGEVYALVTTDKKIWRANQQGRRSTVTKLKDCPEAMIGHGQYLWVVALYKCSSANSSLIRVDKRTGRKKKTGALGEWAQALTTHRNKIWVAHARWGRLSIVDQNTLKSTSITINGASFWSIKANSRSIFAGGREGDNNKAGLLVMVDPNSNREVHRAYLPEGITKIAADEHHVVAISWSGVISIFSAENLQHLRTINLTTGVYAPDTVMIQQDRLLVSGVIKPTESGSIFVINNWRPADTGGSAGYGPNGGVGAGRARPSFNCAKASIASEYAICGNIDLADLDRNLAANVKMAIFNITSEANGGTPADVRYFRKTQRAWLRQRNLCRSDISCLRSSYERRMSDIHEMNEPE